MLCSTCANNWKNCIIKLSNLKYFFMMYRKHRARRMFWIAPFAILGVLVFGGIVMLLWNNVLSPVLHVSLLTFWQALGILVLSKILFSSFGGGGYRRGNWRQKAMWENLSPEQKE